MGKREKLIAQFLKQPPEVSFDDVRYLLKTFDFEEKSVKGSHHTFRNSKGLKITIPKKRGKMVKRVYVQQIIKLLNLDK
ncbi:MAG: type II toxin-antitoxin system HicA family toxin [Synechococcaceae cyanobacterium RL_1_2]|nr:type II toxin-antitoxin system HicA family toxin [Synechococcaceae cyanobacterium RL_1_2]